MDNKGKIEDDVSLTSRYLSNQPVQYSLPGRPPIRIPVPTYKFEDGKQSLVLPTTYGPAIRPDSRYGDPAFIQQLAQSNPLIIENATFSWKYKDRSAAVPILPFLFLGPMSVTRDAKSIDDAGYSMLIAVRSKRMADKFPRSLTPNYIASTDKVSFATFDFDAPFEAIGCRAAATKSINDHIQQRTAACDHRDSAEIPAKILVYCETGNERSAVLVCMYLMIMWGLDASSAYQVVQSRRFSIAIDPEMIDMLVTLDQLLRSESQVRVNQPAAHRMAVGVQPAIAKRGFEEYDTDQNYGRNHLQNEGPSNRPGSEPFRDG